MSSGPNFSLSPGFNPRLIGTCFSGRYDFFSPLFFFSSLIKTNSSSSSSSSPVCIQICKLPHTAQLSQQVDRTNGTLLLMSTQVPIPRHQSRPGCLRPWHAVKNHGYSTRKSKNITRNKTRDLPPDSRHGGLVILVNSPPSAEISLKKGCKFSDNEVSPWLCCQLCNTSDMLAKCQL